MELVSSSHSHPSGEGAAMRIGICFPMSMDVLRQRDMFIDFCRAAEAGGLSTIALGDRFAYRNQDPLIALAMAAGVTSRIGLVTSVLALPARNTGALAKEAASLDVLSGGRFTLGVGISSRPDDFRVLNMEWKGRAARFEQQIGELRSIWRGDPRADGIPQIGPLPYTPGGPKIIVGAISEPALRRAGRIADGIMTWSFHPDVNAQRSQIALMREEWDAAGRTDVPSVIAAMYFALGTNAEQLLKGYLNEYYGYSEQTQDRAIEATTFSEAAIEKAIEAYAQAGVGELLFAAPTADVDQVNGLAEIVRRLGLSVH